MSAFEKRVQALERRVPSRCQPRVVLWFPDHQPRPEVTADTHLIRIVGAKAGETAVVALPHNGRDPLSPADLASAQLAPHPHGTVAEFPANTPQPHSPTHKQHGANSHDE